MEKTKYTDISISSTAFFLKVIGLWMANDRTEDTRRKLALAYTIAALIFATIVEIRDLYYTWGDLDAALYVACNVLSLATVLIKVFIIAANKIQFDELLVYMQENFWNATYDFHEKSILGDCKKTCILFISLVSLIGQSAIVGYIITPIFDNMGKNESERVLVFNMWLGEQLSLSPVFEILFFVQVLSLYHVGVCYYSFDNLLCILSVHVSGQFRILQYRLNKLLGGGDKMGDGKVDSISYAADSYEKLKDCIRQHQELIDYCEKLENVFTLIVLAQVLVFSILICLFGYQIFLANASGPRRLVFVFLMLGSSTLLFMFTYSCHSLIEQSDNVGIAAYSSPWILMPMDRNGKMIRNDLMMIITRARRVCCLTANGFFPISLETYTSVMSTAVSYFTVLRQSTEGAIEQ